MEEEDLFCFEEEKETDLFDFEKSKSEILVNYITADPLDWVLIPSKLVILDQESDMILEGRLGILNSKVGFATTEVNYLFENDEKTKDIKKVDSEYYWNLELDPNTWIQFQIKSDDARVLFPDLKHEQIKITPEDEQDESTLIPMSRFEEQLQIAIETRDRAIKQAHLDYDETVLRLNKEFNQDSNEICGLCCDLKCNVIIMPCLHRLCKGCSSRIGMECPWDRVKFTALEPLE